MTTLDKRRQIQAQPESPGRRSAAKHLDARRPRRPGFGSGSGADAQPRAGPVSLTPGSFVWADRQKVMSAEELVDVLYRRSGVLGLSGISSDFHDRGISEVAGAGILASLGVFSLIGATASGWMCDRFNPRVLLFWYYGLRGLSLVIVPFTQFDVVSLSIFSIFYGLDWVATGPATFALTNQLFGRRDTPVIISWIFAAHQIGGALAAFGAGAVRSFTGDYLLAFMTSGLACLLASLLVLRVTRPAPAIVPAV